MIQYCDVKFEMWVGFTRVLCGRVLAQSCSLLVLSGYPSVVVPDSEMFCETEDKTACTRTAVL